MSFNHACAINKHKKHQHEAGAFDHDRESVSRASKAYDRTYVLGLD